MSVQGCMHAQQQIEIDEIKKNGWSGGDPGYPGDPRITGLQDDQVISGGHRENPKTWGGETDPLSCLKGRERDFQTWRHVP